MQKPSAFLPRETQGKTPWVDPTCADSPGFLVLGAAPAPASSFVSEPQIVPHVLAFCFMGLWTFAWICCPQLPHHPYKNGTHSTCFYSTGGHTPRNLGFYLSGSNATPLVSRYSCRATLVSHFSPYVFAVSHENRATPLKVSQKKALSHPFGGGCRTLSWPRAYHKESCRATGGVAATVSRVALHCDTKVFTVVLEFQFFHSYCVGASNYVGTPLGHLTT